MPVHAPAQNSDSQTDPLRLLPVASLSDQPIPGDSRRREPATEKPRIPEFSGVSATSSLISIEKITDLVDRISCGSHTNQLRFQTSPVNLDSQEAFRHAENQHVAIDVSNKEIRLPMTTGIFHGIHTPTLPFLGLCKLCADALGALFRHRSLKLAGAAIRFAKNINFVAGAVLSALTGTLQNPQCEFQLC